MKKILVATFVAIACAAALAIGGIFACTVQNQQQSEQAAEAEATQQEADLSGINEVAELTTIEARYHQVAKFTYEADEGLTGIWKHGYKKAWREFDGRAYFGIDASKVATLREGNVITIKMPRATLVGDPKIIKMDKLIVKTGFFTDFTDEDEQEMTRIAQEDFRNKAASDTSMINQATENAENILKRWAESVGKTCGDDFTVQFEYID